MLKAKVIVTLKQEVSDPQGQAVCEGINTLHANFAKRVRVGKIIDIDLQETDRKLAEAELNKVCNEVLSNPVIEEYSFVIEGGSK